MRVFVTGGAGFLGRGILRRVYEPEPTLAADSDPCRDWDVTVYSRDETKQDECRRRYPKAHYVLGDVCNLDHLTNAMVGHDIVIHGAALKYIPEAELNAAECVAINVDGSRNVIKAARKAGVKQVVGISTDKACQPVNIYGATKMTMERLFADEHRWGYNSPTYTTVRYGNVVGSTGSVIPLFQRQYAEAGVVRVTDPGMTRFWMGVDEAIDLILAALSKGGDGSVLVPQTRAMTIVDVARAATVDDVTVEVIGVRPGEKQHETLVHYGESVRARRDYLGDLGYIELVPPGVDCPDAEPAFTMASHTPNRHMSVSTMRELIEDARQV